MIATFFESEIVLYVLLYAGDFLIKLSNRWNNSVEFGVAIGCDKES